MMPAVLLSRRAPISPEAPECKAAAFALLAGDMDLAPQHAGEFVCNGKPQSGAAVVVIDGASLLLESLKKYLEPGWLNADIDHGKGMALR
jgi:hypothetical protein